MNLSEKVENLVLPDISVILDETKTAEQIQSAVQEIAAENWIAKNPFGYSILHYDDCVKILRDKRWHNPTKRTMEMFDLGFEEDGKKVLPLNTVEGDDHVRLRRLVGPVFTPKQADLYRGLMRQYAEEIIESLPDHTDLYNEFARIYPIRIITEIFGADKESSKKLDAWAPQIFKIFNSKVREDQESIRQTALEMKDWFQDLIDHKRNNPGSDLITTLINARDEKDYLTTGEIIMLGISILLAGVDTIRNQLSITMALMLQNSEQWSILLSNPEFYSARAAEESMRHSAATRGTGRIASQDIEYNGVMFPEGTLVFPLFSTANRESDKFENPDVFDIRKEIPEKQHLKFGSGIHYCLGAHLARAEMQEALITLAKHCPNIELNGQITWRNSTDAIYGPDKIPVNLNRTSDN